MERYLLSVGESGEVVAEAAAVKSAATPRAGGRILENIRLFLHPVEAKGIRRGGPWW